MARRPGASHNDRCSARAKNTSATSRCRVLCDFRDPPTTHTRPAFARRHRPSVNAVPHTSSMYGRRRRDTASMTATAVTATVFAAAIVSAAAAATVAANAASDSAAAAAAVHDPVSTASPTVEADIANGSADGLKKVRTLQPVVVPNQRPTTICGGHLGPGVSEPPTKYNCRLGPMTRELSHTRSKCRDTTCKPYEPTVNNPSIDCV